MALEQRISFKQQQRLKMTPSLQQAIKLLQMNTLDLVAEVQQEFLENPVLEEQQAEPDTPNQEEPSNDDQDGFDDNEIEAYFADTEGFTPRTAGEFNPDLPTFENTLAEPTDLADHLTFQLDMNVSDDRHKAIGRAIIGNLNHDGYLRASLDEIGQMDASWSRDEVAAVLATVQRFDPVGVAARDLVECLVVQLDHIGEGGTKAEEIVRFHLDKLQKERWDELAQALSIDRDDLRAEVEIIRGLDPKPGLKYGTSDNRYVVPDVYVIKDAGEYRIVLNEDGLPRLRVSPVYRALMRRGASNGTPAEARQFVREKLRAAMRLIKSLEERQRTIYKVAEAIVKFQRDFLDYGIERMRPLVLKDVADEIKMHESTVSRVVNQKYMHTHRGLFEMRFFFHSGIESRGGGSVSSLTVKERIRKIIAGEDSSRPYSDAAIVKILAAEGLKIARRTVAKYREELKIPASSARKPSSL